mmetsp:Transcript_83924/g.222271  ORF Transcript_83924/g.222271 Transcript_83924/m.222271 type:complete len:574 (+) Transcript_83924:1-1722(+)
MVGEGRCGSVFVVQHKQSEQFYACKALRKADQEAVVLRREIEMLRQLDHPNVVRLYEVNEDDSCVFLLMELCRGGDLFTRVYEERHLEEPVARAFAEQMFGALAYCHCRGVVHRDVKPENFLLEDEGESCMTLKLADFGIATRVRPLKLTQPAPTPGTVDANGTLRGSVPYMAPELFANRWSSLVQGAAGQTKLLAAGDLWSCGVVIYVMLSGNLPFGDDPNLIRQGLPPDFTGEVWSGVSEGAVDLITRLMNPDIHERWTAEQALSHGWIRSSPTAGLVQLLGRFGTDAELPLDAESAGSPEITQALARGMLLCLRRWHRLPRLRRLAIACTARRLEASHPSQKLAQLLFQTFSRGCAELRCEQLAQSLDTALRWGGQPAEGSAEPSRPVAASGGRCVTFAEPDAEAAPAAAPPDGHVEAGSGPSITRMKDAVSFVSSMVQKISWISDDSLKELPAAPEAPPQGGLAELRLLGRALDGAGSGSVDYTLLVASVLPPEVYEDPRRVAEAFEQFDFKRRGSFGPEELKMYLGKTKSKDRNNQQFSDMISEFDLDGDGVLDLAEFQQMVSGHKER